MRQSKKIIPDDFLPIEVRSQYELKQLYTWSFQEAAEAQTKYESENPETIGKGPIFLWQAAQELIELYEAYQAGDKGAVLKALHICLFKHLPIPRWCEAAYLNAYSSVKFYRAKTWGEVFGKPHPRGTHLKTKRQETDYSFRVYDRITQIKKEAPSVAIDGSLFDRVGREFGIGGKTLTEEYYYKWKNFFEKK